MGGDFDRALQHRFVRGEEPAVFDRADGRERGGALPLWRGARMGGNCRPLWRARRRSALDLPPGVTLRRIARRHRRASGWRAGALGNRQRSGRRMLLRRAERRVSRHFPVVRHARAIGAVALRRARIACPLSRKRDGSAIIIVLLMWGECLRQALDGGFGFWLLRELGWWWSVSVMLALVADFLRQSPVLQAASVWLGRQAAR